NIASPTLTGVPKAPTAAAGTNTTQLATTAFVTGAVAAIPIATKAEAEAGTDSAKRMTALRVKEAITFNLTAKIPSKAEAEAGTENTKTMTPLRTKEAISLQAQAIADKAVADAAVPFPDVWIPFNDSLRMLAGKGDDIKVGDYVVATQASFSRASTATYIDKSGVMQTAAINEPRFEKEGLLIEGQSTNLIAQQLWTARAGGNFVTNKTVNGENEGEISFAVGMQGTSAAAVSGVIVDPVVKGEMSKYISLDIKFSRALVGTEVILVVETGDIGTNSQYNFTASNSSSLVGGFKRLSVMDKSPNAYSGSSGIANYVYIFPVSAILDTPLVVTVRRVQAEKLPFATSYIPTTGVAATRAADVCSIPSKSNFLDGGAATYAMEVIDYKAAPNQWLSPLDLYQGSQDPFIEGGVVKGIASLSVTYASGLLAGKFNAGASANGTAVFSGGVYAEGPSKKSVSLNATAGFVRHTVTPEVKTHIRNVRIWNFELTEAQIKGLK
ncbi:MAG: phage head spike fiber domain-containing protein, partial [Shewanella sp.]